MAYSEVRCGFENYFVVSMDNSVGRVATSRNSFFFPLCAGSNPIYAFISFPFLLYNIFTCILQSFLDNSFNIYINTKCPLFGTLVNTKMPGIQTNLFSTEASWAPKTKWLGAQPKTKGPRIWRKMKPISKPLPSIRFTHN